MKKEYIHFVLLCLSYLFLMNIFNNFELGHDQSRHANDGALWYYYLHGYGSREFSSYDEFIFSFPEFSRSKIAWYFLYDPPVHALMTAASYTVFGMNEFAARFPSQLLNILGIFFLFLLAKEFTTEKNALLIAFLYGSIPLVFHLGRDAMIDAGAASFLIAWMYFSFFLASKHESWKKYCCFSAGGIALALAILTKYTAVFFFVGFLAVYGMYLLWSNFKNKEKLFCTSNKQLLFCIMIQIGLLVVLSLPWISYSWFTGGVLEKLAPVRTENWTQQGYLYNIFYLFYELGIESVGLFVLLFLLYFGRNAIHQKHAPLLSFIVATLFIVPLYFTNIQPRYFLAIFAFASIIILF
ncbi:MAG: glycosyltransferase family 39 protein [Nanoarchaeota archaeon]